MQQRASCGGRLVLLTGLLIALAGCELAQQAADDVARGQAKRSVNAIVASQFPGVDAAPVTDCIIEAATAQEILQIAGSSATGASADGTQAVLQIAQRPETMRCIARNGLPLFRV
jgi:hypothetical protein